MPDVVEHDVTAIGALNLNFDVRIVVRGDAHRTRLPRGLWRRMFQHDRRLGIGIWPEPGFDHRLEIALHGQAGKHHAGESVRVLVHESFRRLRHETHVARRELAVDLIDWNARRDVAQTKQIGEPRAI